MRSIEDKSCYDLDQHEISGTGNTSFEFHKANGTNRSSSHHRMAALGKPTPSKWDDAQKWLVGLSRGGEKNQSCTKPRNSNADDRRLIAPAPPPEEHDYSSGEEDGRGGGGRGGGGGGRGGGGGKGDGFSLRKLEVETKKVDGDESVWRINKSSEELASDVRSICVRDMGTEMTPIASQEPSRTATPIRATTPATRSPIASGSSTPVRSKAEAKNLNRLYEEDLNGNKSVENDSLDQTRKENPLETRAIAWDEAERAKYMARYKQEEVKIQAWENHEKRKAEMEMRKIEVKAERLKSRAQEKFTNKLASTRRIAEEKRANAEANLNEKAVKTSERADYIRRTGHLPSSFSFKLPSLCW